MKIGRNAPCPCGSGKKYKQCCMGQDQRRDFSLVQKLLAALFVGVILVGLVSAIGAYRNQEPSLGGAKVWSEEHQHWH